MNELDKYLFDINGYMIIENAIDQDEITELNRLIDAQNLTEPGLATSEARFGSSGSLFDENNLSAGGPPPFQYQSVICDFLKYH